MLKIYTNVLFENYLNFKGRARRKEFWLFFLFNTIIILGVIPLFNLIFPSTVLFSPIYMICILLPGIAVGVRRMHDINKSGWYFLIPFYNVYLCTVIGDEGENQYGSDPIGEEEYLRELGKDLN